MSKTCQNFVQTCPKLVQTSLDLSKLVVAAVGFYYLYEKLKMVVGQTRSSNSNFEVADMMFNVYWYKLRLIRN